MLKQRSVLEKLFGPMSRALVLSTNAWWAPSEHKLSDRYVLLWGKARVPGLGRKEIKKFYWVCSTATEERGLALLASDGYQQCPWDSLADASSSFLTQLLFFSLMFIRPPEVLYHVSRPPPLTSSMITSSIVSLSLGNWWGTLSRVRKCLWQKPEIQPRITISPAMTNFIINFSCFQTFVTTMGGGPRG